MRQHTSPSAGSTVVDKLKVYEGGTGVTDPSTILAAMDAIPASLINQPNGVAGLNSAGQLSAAVLAQDVTPTISLVGPVSVVRGSSTLYAINNHDAFTNYVVSAVGGTAALEDTGIRFIAGNTPMAGSITINGRTVNINIVDYMPLTPTLSVIDTGGSGNNAVLNLNGSSFQMNSGSDTHLNTDWQIATDAAFTNIVSQSMADSVNKTGWTSASVSLSNTYYARIRYRSSSGYVSSWSSIVTVTTKANYTLNVNDAMFVAGDSSSSDYFGQSIAITPDSSRIAIINRYGHTYVFTKSGSSWSLEQKLLTTNSGDTGDFVSPKHLDIDYTGTRIVIGRYLDSTVASYGGSVYVFVRNTTTNVWTQEQKISPADVAASDYFGAAVSIDETGTRIAVSAKNKTVTSLTYCGAVYIYLRTGSVWTLEQKFSANDPVASQNFGQALQLDASGTRVAIGAYGSKDSGTTYGGVYIFTRSGTVWTQEAKLNGIDKSASWPLGYSCAMSSDGSRVVSASGTTVSYVYVFIRTGTVWAQEAKIIGPTDAGSYEQNYQFGVQLAICPNGNKIAVYNRVYYSGTQNSGTVQVYKRVGAAWQLEATLNYSPRQTGERFGNGLALDQYGNRLIIGAAQRTYNSVTQCGVGFSYVN